MRYLLGADIGTTRAKCALFDEQGRLRASATREYPCHHDQPGRSEQDAGDWWAALVQCVREVQARVGGKPDVAAMCIATQGGTLVPVDGRCVPLRRAIVWNDVRCTEERALLAAQCPPEDVWRKSGWRLGNGLKALQILWLREHEPDVFDRAWKLLSVPDYLAYRLTGMCVTDPSNAGIDQLANIDQNRWDVDILRAIGIENDRLADIVPSGQLIGPLTSDAARELGLSSNTLLVAGAHDQYLCALGSGTLADGDVFLATGTCWAVAALSVSRPERFAISRSALPGLWGALQSQQTGGEALEWLRRQVLDPEQRDYARINEAVDKVPPGANGLTFYPLLNGATHPTPMCDVRGAIIGLSSGSNRMDMARAVMEGVCFQTLWMMESFGLQGMRAIRKTGGALYSDVWVQMVADIANLPVSAPALADAGCVGAAMLAGMATGIFQSAAEAWAAVNRGGCDVLPSPNAAAYRALFARYKRNHEHLIAMYE